MTENNINETKNRKMEIEKVQKHIKNRKNKASSCNFDKNMVSIYAWVKTLVCVHDALPNIIKLIDKMVTAKASNPAAGSAIFGDYKHGTFNQIQEVLDMQERKLSLINVYTIIETMVQSLSDEHREFVRLKYYKRKTMQYISQALEIDERTAFRWSNTVLNKLVDFCIKNNWSEIFFISQTKGEPWIKDHYNKYYKNLLACVKN